MPPNTPRTTARQPGTATTTAPATNGSQTITQPTNPTLRLRAQNAHPPPSSSQSQRRRIQWDESVVDNEGMGKKSSKVCCIYHAPHEPGDSESEDSSSSDSEGSDGEPDLSRAQRAGGGGRRGRGVGEGEDDGKGKGKERKASPNAYERQPRQKGKAKKEG